MEKGAIERRWRRLRARQRRRGRSAAFLVLAAVLAGCATVASRESVAPDAGGPTAAAGGAVVATVPIDAFGTGIAIGRDGTRAYVCAGDAVLVVDVAAREVVGKIVTGDMPYAIALSADGTRGYAVDLQQREMWILDLAGSSVVRKVGFGGPRRPVLRPGVAVSADGATAYATISQPEGAGFDLLEIVDTTSGARTQRALDFHPGQLVAAPSGGLLWIAGCRGLCSDGTLHGVDPARRGDAAKVTLPSVPGGLALAPDGSRAYVANGLGASVSVVDLSSHAVVADVRVGAEPLGVAASPDGRRVYVTSFQSNTLSAIDTASNAVIAEARVGASPRAIAVTPDGRFAWVTHSTARISIVDLAKLSG